jgi:hypothetical protein
MEQGRLYTAELLDNSGLYSWIDKQLEDELQHILLFSRQPHKRLLEHIDVTKVESYWLSERITAGALEPSLEKIAHLITSKLHNHHGLIVVEGLEWLVSLHGDDAVLSFIRQIRDEVHRYSINFHRVKRSKSLFNSRLKDINGIGAKKIRIIWDNYENLQDLKSDTIKNIKNKTGFTEELIKKIKNNLK